MLPSRALSWTLLLTLLSRQFVAYLCRLIGRRVGSLSAAIRCERIQQSHRMVRQLSWLLLTLLHHVLWKLLPRQGRIGPGLDGLGSLGGLVSSRRGSVQEASPINMHRRRKWLGVPERWLRRAMRRGHVNMLMELLLRMLVLCLRDLGMLVPLLLSLVSLYLIRWGALVIIHLRVRDRVMLIMRSRRLRGRRYDMVERRVRGRCGLASGSLATGLQDCQQ